jgi:alkanesulfonate monooxygenase SsuD/methylene tetrahydromethanopterin reductase-like flavin-dependent oxidoreductase (luciferase family)
LKKQIGLTPVATVATVADSLKRIKANIQDKVKNMMQFGLFGSAQVKRGTDDPNSIQGYENWIEFSVAAEALGYHSIFTVEHHFTGIGQVSESLNLMTYLAAKTTKLRLGTGVTTLPWHNPVLLAEQAATLDLLSGDRLYFGVGKGCINN